MHRHRLPAVSGTARSRPRGLRALAGLALLLVAGCRPGAADPAKPAGADADTDTDTDADADTGTGDPGPRYDPALGLAASCWADLDAERAGFPDYEALGLVPGSCAGTAHQRIENIERVVFLGDSITVGTPPTLGEDYFRHQLEAPLRARFGDHLSFESCAEFGARTDDFLPRQIPECFPAPDPRPTLVLGTMGGNDLFAAAQVVLDGGTEEEGLAVLERAIGHHREAMAWFRGEGAARFPGGVVVVMANVYEFTDTTGDLSACELATTFGFGGEIDAVVEATALLNTGWAEVARETGTDLLFMNEAFCGHGFGRDDPDGPCHRGAGAALWFDPSCIHPNTEGHTAIADQFLALIDASVAAAR